MGRRKPEKKSLGSAKEQKHFPSGSAVNNLLSVQEMQVRSLGWEDPLEKEMATHSSILAWVLPGTEEPVRLQLMRSQRVGRD